MNKDKSRHSQKRVKTDPSRSFREFLVSLHADITERSVDMADLNVDMDFEKWLDGMDREELFAWVEVYREDEVLRVLGEIE